MERSSLLLTARACLALLVLLAACCAWLPGFDRLAGERVDAGLDRALVSFASARALNAAISVAQGTEIAVEPGGIGLTFTPGEVLDPINDLVERFSNLMLLASVAFGMQKLLLAIGAWWAISLLLSAAALVWTIYYFYRGATAAWLSRLLLALLLVRFTVPLVAVGTDALFRQFLAPGYSTSQQALDTASGKLQSADPTLAAVTQEQGLVEALRDWWTQNTDMTARFAELKQTAERIAVHMVRLIAIFILQTLVIPLLLLWILYTVLKQLLATGYGKGNGLHGKK